MKLPQFAIGVLERAEQAMFKALDGLSSDELHWQPALGSNSIGWLMWHLTRVQDRALSAMEEKEQAWTAEGWHAKYGRAADPEDRGARDTPEQVAAFQPPDVETLLAYYNAVGVLTHRFLNGLALADLERPVPGLRPGEMVPLASRLMLIMDDNLQHMGQVAYLRGLIRGAGWLGV